MLVKPLVKRIKSLHQTELKPLKTPGLGDIGNFPIKAKTATTHHQLCYIQATNPKVSKLWVSIIRYIPMRYIHDPQRMNHYVFGDPLTSYLAGGGQTSFFLPTLWFMSK